jgi:hypothetical protein
MTPVRRFPISAVLPGLLSLALAGCGSSARTATSPGSLNRCGVSASGGGSIPAGGGTGRISVSAERECSWSARAEGSWLSIKAGTTGQGDGTVEFAAASNPDPAPRTGAVVLNDQRIEVTQEPGECVITLEEESAIFPRSGGSGRIGITASSAMCAWEAAPSESWIVLRSEPAGKGNGHVDFDVMPADGPARSGTIRVAGHPFSVEQSDGCTYIVAPLSHQVGSAGGPISVSVTTPGGCEWQASSGVPWIALGGQSRRTGPGTVTFVVAESTVARSDTVSVAGRSVAISQSAAPAPAPPAPPPTTCSFAVSPEVASFGAAGGTASARVTTAGHCAWTATSHAPWIQVASGASGMGAADVSYAVASSTGEPRSGTLTIAGRTLTVNQAGACTYTLSARAAEVPAAGGGGSVAVTAPAACPWTAASHDAWLTVTAGASGAGNGTVTFSAAEGTGSARTGSLTIAGQPFSVTQPAGCTFSISPESRSVDAGGAILTVTVTAPNGCAWTASSQAGWLAVRPEGAAGSGSVQVTVAENTGAARSGTATIAGRAFTVTQAAPACSYSVKPDDISISSGEKLVKVDVKTSRGCSWEAESHERWIRIVSGGKGTGDGQVWFFVSQNEGAERKGTLTIAGQTVTVRQKKDKD